MKLGSVLLEKSYTISALVFSYLLFFFIVIYISLNSCQYLLDELIRHITVSCAERGYLLLRVRNELHMRVDTYRTLAESSMAYSLRKTLQAEVERTEQEEKVLPIFPIL